MRHIIRRATLAVASLACAAGAQAQNAVGNEFQVNVTTAGHQIIPRIASDGAGRFTVVWEDWVSYPNRRVGVRHFGADATPLGGETIVSTAAFSSAPDVASDTSGNIIVIWQAPDASASGIQARRVSPSGLNGPIFQVNSYTGGNQLNPAVASAPGGSSLAVWSDDVRTKIMARVVPSTGSVAGFEFDVSGTSGNPGFPSVAFLPSVNRYVVVWRTTNAVPSVVKGRKVDPGAAAPDGPEFLVSTGTGDQSNGSVAARADGHYVVAWLEAGAGIKYRLFDPSGPVGSDATVPTATIPGPPRVAMAEQGDFVIVWGATDNDSHGRRFDAAGNPLGSEFRVNTYTTGRQIVPAIIMRGTGDFVVAWQGNYQDGSGYGVFGQRFGTLAPAALDVDPAGNKVWDRNETAAVNPSWHNYTSGTLAPNGALSALTCPSPFTCSITDASASYLITSGATATCTAPPCYQVNNTGGGSPTGAHKDATALETLTSGELKSWKLHIGPTFGDVPTSSGFYRYIETIVHRGITGGCGGTSYCPTTSLLRQEMPVFVLVAKEGAGYAPPDCTTSPFTDVPAGGVYCRWIQELFNRGVISGCGGSNYCPGDPVTREQMPLFVLKTLDPNLNPPACTTAPFTDVPPSSGFCKWIKEAVNRGIVTGCGGGNYCPTDPVTREQMAVFLSVGFNLTLYGLY